MNKEFTRMQKLAGLITEGLYTSDEKAPMGAMSHSKVTKKELKEKIKEMMLSDDVTGGAGRMYYHVLEDVGGEIGHQGYYHTEEEAQKRANELADMFPRSFFYVEASNSEAEPNNVTLEGETPEDIATREMGSLDEAASDDIADVAPKSHIGSLVKAVEGIIAALKDGGFNDEDIYDFIVNKIKTLSVDEALFEAKKDEESDTEDVIVADTEEEVPAEGGEDVTADDTQVDVNMDGVPDVDTGSPEAKKAFTSAVDAYNDAKALGDPKYTQILANALTYYNKNIILKAGRAQA